MDAVSAGKARFRPLRSQAPTPAEQDAKLREVAQGFEEQFLKQIVKGMRSTVQEAGLIKTGMAGEIYRGDLDNEYVKNWLGKGGVGLADLIHQQLLARYGEQLGIRPPAEPLRGPLPLREKDQLHQLKQITGQSSSSQPGLQLRMSRPAEANQLLAPWSGNVLGVQRLDDAFSLVRMGHEQGWESQLVFGGQPRPGLENQTVEGGSVIGDLSPGGKEIQWRIDL